MPFSLIRTDKKNAIHLSTKTLSTSPRKLQKRSSSVFKPTRKHATSPACANICAEATNCATTPLLHRHTSNGNEHLVKEK